MNDDAIEFVILEDEEFVALEESLDSKAKKLKKLWRAEKWDVCAINNTTGRFYAIEVKCPTSVDARNEFVAKMKTCGIIGWSDWKIRKL